MESSLKWYSDKIFKIDNLSREEEKNFSRLGKAGDKGAREKFLNSFLKIVPKIAKKLWKFQKKTSYIIYKLLILNNRLNITIKLST